ncbi:MAG: phosphate signaling complex protein PhoU [Succiniclasticum sp.]|nr:phosphate signaling complex protein PhoU [Succiniclasticum sp.]
MRSRFDEQLLLLNRELIRMGALCEESIDLAAKALIANDTKALNDILPLDDEIDNMERSIEALCLKLLLQQQPVASDLRQISAALKMITDLERIGDQAKDIADIVASLNGRAVSECEDIRQMAVAAMKMVTESIDAFVQRDTELAMKTIAHDDVVDNYFQKVKISLIQIITKNPEDGEYALDLMMIAKYFEKIGDHAVNIANWVLFSITGTHISEE